jgi:16S rRNA (cytosine1402-N4)-methyltransferase
VHVPVLYQPIISFLRPSAGCRLVDCTVGGGGHAYGLLQASQPDGQLLGLDLDPDALAQAEIRLSTFGERAILKRASYEDLTHLLEETGWEMVDAILLDLGVSSFQLDTAERGFSFMKEAALDMRFDPGAPLKADDLVNGLSEADLADILYRYGEERRSRQIARAIVAQRPIHSTRRLAEVVAKTTRSGKEGLHPATRTFQALRIAVNHELEAIQNVLPQAISSLASGGRLAVISFHSLEDRIVKHYFQQESRDCICPPEQPVCTCGHKASLVLVTRKPVRPAAEEIKDNPRARSARLRVVEKIER